jgi:hypothetical protein
VALLARPLRGIYTNNYIFVASCWALSSDRIFSKWCRATASDKISLFV